MSKISMNEVYFQCEDISNRCTESIQMAKLELDSIQLFLDDRILQGKIYQNIKGYFGNNIIPLLIIYIDLNRMMSESVNELKNSFASVMEIDDVLDLNIISSLLSEISDLRDRLYYYNSKGHRRRRSSVWNAILELKKLLEKLREVTAVDKKAYHYFDSTNLKEKQFYELLNKPFIGGANQGSNLNYDDYLKTSLVSLYGVPGGQTMQMFLGSIKEPLSSTYRSGFNNTGVITDEVRGERPFKYGYYGSYQGSPLITYTQGSEEQKKVIDDIVHSYYPSLGNNETERLLVALKYHGCTYASVTNIIFQEYEGNQTDFEKKFHMPMYVTDQSGNQLYNYDGLMTDFFLSAAASTDVALQPKFDNTATVPLIDGMTLNDSIVANYQNRGNNYDMLLQKYDLYLESKNITYEKSNYEVTSNNYSFNDYLENSSNNIVLGITPYVDENGIMKTIPMYKSDGTIFQLNGNHGVNVTGINQNGDIEIATWGEKYTIHSKDLEGTGTLVLLPKIINN